MSGFQLKTIASISMFIDHVGAFLYPNIAALRVIGRLAFPIYCFLLVQGFFYTGSIKKYLVRLGVFALISEIPYDLVQTGNWYHIKSQNVFFTLFLGVCCMVVCQWAVKKQQPIVMILGIVATTVLAQLIGVDYQWYGIAVIMIFYLFSQSKPACYPAFIGITGLYSVVYMQWLQLSSIYALAPIYLYNGKRGKFSLRYGFYLFYPVHLFILFIISKFVFLNY